MSDPKKKKNTEQKLKEMEQFAASAGRAGLRGHIDPADAFSPLDDQLAVFQGDAFHGGGAVFQLERHSGDPPLCAAVINGRTGIERN